MNKRIVCLLTVLLMLFVVSGCSNQASEQAVQVGKVAWNAINEDEAVSKQDVVIKMMAFDTLANLKKRFSDVPDTTWERIPDSGWLVEIETATNEYFVAVKSDMTVSPLCYSRKYAEKTINDAKNEQGIGAMFSPTIISLWAGHELLRAEFNILAYPVTVADTADHLVIHRLTDKTVSKIIN